MDIASDDHRAVPEDLMLSFNGRRVIRRARDGEFIIGREVPPSHIAIDHPAISRLHIRLVPGARWALIDYDSRNGVYLDGRRIAYETPITDCMTVYLGAPDGIPVAFHYIATEEYTPSAADEADPDIVRTGRAVVDRCLQLGLSLNELGRLVIDPQKMAAFIEGTYWPQPAACAALEIALQWPAGSLEAIRRGQRHGEITDVITPDLRRALLIDSATLTLAAIATAIADLPAATDPRCPRLAETLRQRLDVLESELVAARTEGCDVADLFAAIARIYTHLLVRPIARGAAPALGRRVVRSASTPQPPPRRR